MRLMKNSEEWSWLRVLIKGESVHDNLFLNTMKPTEKNARMNEVKMIPRVTGSKEK
jgi:hypothetical protein